MAFCKACGQEIGTAAFCPKCGTNQDAAVAPAGAGAPAVAAPSSEGLQENVAALLAYVLGWLTGIIFLLIEPYNRNKLIRFHAFQGLFLLGASIVVNIIMSTIIGILWSMVFLMKPSFGSCIQTEKCIGCPPPPMYSGMRIASRSGCWARPLASRREKKPSWICGGSGTLSIPPFRTHPTSPISSTAMAALPT